MLDHKIHVIFRRTMLGVGWCHVALTTLLVFVMASGRGSASTPAFTLLFLVMALVSFRLARKLRRNAYGKVFENA